MIPAEAVESEYLANQNGEVSDEELDEWIAELKIYCAKRGRQIEIADALKVSTQTVQYWLTGKRRPNLKNFLAIRKIMRRARHKSGE